MRSELSSLFRKWHDDKDASADHGHRRGYIAPCPLKVAIPALRERERYVYDLAKDLNLSRQVVQLHLKRLENAGFVESDLRLEDNDMRAKKFFKLKDFDVRIGVDDLMKIFE